MYKNDRSLADMKQQGTCTYSYATTAILDLFLGNKLNWADKQANNLMFWQCAWYMG